MTKLRDFLRISDAADYLGVSPNTLRNWERAGKIVAHRHPVNRYRLFKPEDLDGNWKPFRSVGCSMCNNGYKGRVGIYQVMPISEEIQRIILNAGMATDIAVQAQREGVRDLRQSGLLKVRSGMTTLEEVISVTNE